jgi:single-strand DNA-binding protein
MTLKNTTQLFGNIGTINELKETPKSKVITLTLAVNEKFKNKAGEEIKNTHWFSLEAWGKTAEYIQNNFSQGNYIAIEGKLLADEYEDKEGNKRTAFKIRLNEIINLSNKK